MTDKRSPLPLILGVLIFAEILSTMESAMIFSAFKAIIAETGSPITAGWLISAYFVVAGPAAVICGRLGDMYGRKRVLIGILGVIGVGSLISATSPSLPVIIFGRAMQGVSGAIMPLCIGLVRTHWPPEKTALPLGLVLGSGSLGTVLALVMAGVIVDTWNWHHIFTFSAGASWLALAAVWLWVPRSAPGRRQALDWIGAILYAPAIAGLLFGLSGLNSPALPVTAAILMIAASVIVLGIWVFHELRHPSPLVDVRSFTDRAILWTNVTAFIAAVGPQQLPQVFALLLQQPPRTGVGFGMSATAASLLKAPSNLSASIAAAFAGYAAGRWSGRTIVVLGGLISVVSWIVVTMFHQVFWFFFALTLVASIATMMQNVGLTNIIVSAAPPEKTSESLGAISVVRALGAAIGSQGVATLLSLWIVADPKGGHGYPSDAAHTLSFFAITICCVLSVFSALALPRATGSRSKDLQATANSTA